LFYDDDECMSPGHGMASVIWGDAGEDGKRIVRR
jgi:hypothetical protein